MRNLLITSIIPLTMSGKRQLTYAFLENLRARMPLRRKVLLVAGNTLAKIRRLRGCCGNYGQPGC